MADHGATFLLVTILLLVVILLIFGMKYFAGMKTARLRIISEDAYRDLAARSVKAQEDNAAALSRVMESLTQLEARIGRVETVLKEVE